MIKKACNYAILVLAVIVYLCGCQRADLDISGNETLMAPDSREISYDIYCQLEEYSIPDPYSAMRELVGETKMVAGDPILFQDGICQQMVVYTDAMDDILGAYLQIFTWDSGKWTAISMQDDFEIDGSSYSHIGSVFTSTDGGLYCFVYTQEQEPYLATLGVDGVEAILHKADSLEKEYVEAVDTMDANILLDAAGKAYLYCNKGYYGITGAATTITCFDEQIQEKWRVETDGWILGGIQGREQSSVCWYGTNAESQIVFQQMEEEKKLLYDMEGMYARELYAAYATDDLLCLTDSQHLWVVGEQGPGKVYSYIDNGYYLDVLSGMNSDENGSLQILAQLDGELMLLRASLTDQKPVAEKKEITLALQMKNVALNNLIARFNRQNPEYMITLLLPEDGEDMATFRKRIQMELSAGRGPDMLGNEVVQDLESLVENGYLECLNDYEFDVEAYVAAAFEDCMVDGKLYGIPYDYAMDFVAYRTEDVEGLTSITMEELMSRVEASEARVLQRGLDGMQIVLKYALSDLSNEDYIDWENGESHLNEQPFLQVLEFAKKYADNEKAGEVLEQEEIFAAGIDGGMYSINQIRQLNDLLGKDLQVLGYPREKGNGIYLNTNAIYVNSRSDAMDGINAFLQYLISEEAQIRYVIYDMYQDVDKAGGFLAAYPARFPVNRAALEALIENEHQKDEKNKYTTTSGEEVYLVTPYTQEQFDAVRFLAEHAQVSDYNIFVIQEMVSEELAPYFAGAVTAEEAASILNSRVQIYLNENK